MRVALVAMRTSHHEDTPSARRFVRIGRSLAARGHDVTVFTSRFWEGSHSAIEEHGVVYRAVTKAPATLPFFVRLPYVLAKHRPDVVHTRVTPVQVVQAASIGASLARAPYLVEWYGDEDLPEDSRWTRWAATDPAMVVTPSELVRTDVRELGVGDESARVIPESIDFEYISQVAPAEDIDVAFAHHLDESANLESLLLGLAELRGKDWTATIIGDGPQRAAYEEQAADLRIDDRVDFVGACDRERRIAIYRGAHVFVQTADRSVFARELLWALACGCVGIVEYQAESSAHELIEGYERSFRVTNPQQLADAIVEAGDLEHRDRDEDWAEYDHSAVAGDYIDLYQELLEDHGWF